MIQIDVNAHLEPDFHVGIIPLRDMFRLDIQSHQYAYGGIKIFTDVFGLQKIRDAIDEHLAAAEADEAVEVVGV